MNLPYECNLDGLDRNRRKTAPETHSLFVGPNNAEDRMLDGSEVHFGAEACELYCPDPTRWNRDLYYRMPDPELLLGDHLQETYGEETMLRLRRMLEMEMKQLPLLNVHLDEKGKPVAPQWLAGVPGVWAICGKHPVLKTHHCLDVHETVDIAYELITHEADLQLCKSASLDDPMFEGELFSLAKRTRAIGNWLDLEYRLVVAFASEMEICGVKVPQQPALGGKFLRELVEAQCAWNVKSFYWNRNYFQPVTQQMVFSQMESDYIMSKR